MNDLAGIHIAIKGGTDDVEPAGFATHYPLGLLGVADMAEHQGPDAMAIPQGEKPIRSTDNQAECTSAALGRDPNRSIPIQAPIHGLLNRKGDQFGVGGGGELTGNGGQVVTQLSCIHQIAIVGKGERANAGVQHHRLGIANLATAGSGIAVVTDGQIAGEALQHGLIKHLAHQAHVLVQPHLAIGIKNGNTSRFLASVLQGVETEVGEVGHRLPRRQHGIHAAGFLGLVRMHHQHRPIIDHGEISFCISAFAHSPRDRLLVASLQYRQALLKQRPPGLTD